jgi:hypothetical protein
MCVMLAEEWKKFALIYSPAILYGFLPPEGYAHWMDFVGTVRSVLEKVTPAGIEAGTYYTILHVGCVFCLMHVCLFILYF